MIRGWSPRILRHEPRWINYRQKRDVQPWFRNSPVLPFRLRGEKMRCAIVSQNRPYYLQSLLRSSQTWSRETAQCLSPVKRNRPRKESSQCAIRPERFLLFFFLLSFPLKILGTQSSVFVLLALHYRLLGCFLLPYKGTGTFDPLAVFYRMLNRR